MDPEPDRLTGAGVPAAHPSDPAVLEREIEHTRAEMSETIDALGARLQPSYLKEQAQEAIRDTARSAGTSMIDTLKDNPLPTAIAGLSIAWLIANRSSGERRYGSGGSLGTYAGSRYAAVPTGAYAGGVAARSGGSAGASLTDRAGDVADGARERASEFADEAREQFDRLGERAHDVQQQATSWLGDQMDQNPLGVGAVALAAGALVGLSMPTTEAERNVMGEPAGRIVDQARHVAEDQFERVRDAASHIVDETRETAGTLADEATDATREAAGNASGGGKATEDRKR